MKKKVALLLAFVMVLSLLPMNVFGNPEPAAPVEVFIPANTITRDHAIMLNEGGAHFDLIFTGASFVTTPSSLLVSVGTAGVNATVAPVTGVADRVRISFPGTVAANTFPIPAEGATVPAISFTLTGLERTSSGVDVELVNTAGASLLPQPMFTGVIRNLTDGGNHVTIPTGIVQNPLQEPSRTPQPFRVTIPMDQLHTHPGAVAGGLSAWLSFTLHGTDSGDDRIAFIPATGNATEGSGSPPAWVRGTPVISISPYSQINRISDGVRLDATQLFHNDLPGVVTGPAAYRGRLATSGTGGTHQTVDAWLTLSDRGMYELNRWTPGATYPAGAPVGPTNISGLTGTLVLEISRIAAASDNARISVIRRGGFTGVDEAATVPLVTNQLLTFAGQAHGVNITAETVRPFVSGLIVPQIRIQERRPQSLHMGWTWASGTGTTVNNIDGGSSPGDGRGGATNHEIRLLGPRDYVWNLGWADAPGGQGGLGPVQPFTITHNGVFNNPPGEFAFVGDTVDGAGNVVPGNFRVLNQHIDAATGRPALVIEVTVPNRGAWPRQNQIGQINLNNLALVPVRDVPQGNIEIDVAFGRFTGQGTGVTGAVWMPIAQAGVNLTNAEMAALMQLGRDRTDRQPTLAEARIVTNNANVAAGVPQRPYAGGAGTPPSLVRPELTEDNLHWMMQGGTVTQETDAWRARGVAWAQTNLLVGERTEATLVMSVEGDIPTRVSGQRNFPISTAENPWGHGGTHPWDSNATNNAVAGSRSARVQIEEIVPGAFDTGWINSIVEFDLNPADGAQFMHASWRIIVGAGLPGGVGWSQVGLHDDDFLPQWGAAAVPMLTPDRLRLFVPRQEVPHVRRTLEVVFFFSTVAGFEAIFDDNELAVSVSGNAVTNLEADNREEVIAFIEDPIRVELDGALVRMEVGQVMTPFEITPIGDLVITEREAGTLRRGTSMRIGIEASPIAVLGGHALVNTQVILDNSGLEVRATQRNVGGQNAYIFLEVIRESQTNPGSFRLTNNAVMGTFLPGIEYGISVNAIPVAAWPTPANINNNPIAQNTARGLSGPGNFDEIPYFVQIVTFDAFDYIGLPPGVGIPGPGQGAQIRLHAGMMSIPVPGGTDIEDPFILWTNPADGNAVGMLALRGFTILRGFPEPTWDAPTATIVGTNQFGQTVTVVVTQGSNFATINGTQVDIATFAGQSGPAGSIQPQNVGGRLFLPLRFIANAFDIPVGWDAGVVTLG